MGHSRCEIGCEYDSDGTRAKWRGKRAAAGSARETEGTTAEDTEKKKTAKTPKAARKAMNHSGPLRPLEQASARNERGRMESGLVTLKLKLF